MKRSFLPVEKLASGPHSSILGFPRAAGRQLNARARELESLGVTGVSFEGPTRIGTLNVLGKGHVGVVVVGRLGRRIVAVKIRRTDSQRGGLEDESGLLQKANRVGVGPRFIAGSKNFLVMEYLGGQKISDWAAGLKKTAVGEAKATLAKVLQDCFRLDMEGIDHGELSTISRHVIVGKKTTVVDFESSSVQRRVSNITSATQGLFIGSGIAKRVASTYRIPTRRQIIRALREYKRDVSEKSYENLLRTLKL